MANSNYTLSTSRPPLTVVERFDLETHPDGDLLRLCASLWRLRDAVTEVEAAIGKTAALTQDGRVMKELSL